MKAAKKLPIRDVKKKYEVKLMGIEGVEGIGITEKSRVEVLVVYTSLPPTQMKEKIPVELEGHKILIQPTGKFEAY